MILNDAYAGHRKWWDPNWVPSPAVASVWTDWDYILVRVYQYIEDYTSSNGQLAWVEEDPDVWWEVSKAESGYERAVDEYRSNNDVKTWESVRARPKWEDDVEPPSMEKWLRRLEQDEEGGFDRPQGGTPRPPTPEELARLRNPEQNA